MLYEIPWVLDRPVLPDLTGVQQVLKFSVFRCDCAAYYERTDDATRLCDDRMTDDIHFNDEACIILGLK